MDQEVSSTFNDLERKLKALEDELAQVDLDVEQPAAPDPAGMEASPEVVRTSPPSGDDGDGITWETSPSSQEMANPPAHGHIDEPRSSGDSADGRPDELVSSWDAVDETPAEPVDDKPESARSGEPVVRWEGEEGARGVMHPRVGGVTDSTGGSGEASVVWDEQLSGTEVESVDVDQQTDEPIIGWGEERAVPDDPIPPSNAGETMSPNEPISSPAAPGAAVRGSKLASYRSQLDRIARELSDITDGLSEEQNELLRFRQQLEQTTKGLIGDYERLLTSLKDDGDPPATY